MLHRYLHDMANARVTPASEDPWTSSTLQSLWKDPLAVKAALAAVARHFPMGPVCHRLAICGCLSDV